MKRIAGREVKDAPHETLLVIDAVTGQNGLEQARQFTKVRKCYRPWLPSSRTAKGGIAVRSPRNCSSVVVGNGEQVEIYGVDAEVL